MSVALFAGPPDQIRYAHLMSEDHGVTIMPYFEIQTGKHEEFRRIAASMVAARRESEWVGPPGIRRAACWLLQHAREGAGSAQAVPLY